MSISTLQHTTHHPTQPKSRVSIVATCPPPHLFARGLSDAREDSRQGGWWVISAPAGRYDTRYSHSVRWRRGWRGHRPCAENHLHWWWRARTRCVGWRPWACCRKRVKGAVERSGGSGQHPFWRVRRQTAGHDPHHLLLVRTMSSIAMTYHGHSSLGIATLRLRLRPRSVPPWSHMSTSHPVLTSLDSVQSNGRDECARHVVVILMAHTTYLPYPRACQPHHIIRFSIYGPAHALEADADAGAPTGGHGRVQIRHGA